MPNRSLGETQLFQLVRAALDESVSHSKCWRMVDAYLASRRVEEEDVRVLTYADPTGEKAVYHLMRQRQINNKKEGPTWTS
ncbi:MAG: hypothetical protein ACR2LE_05065 [Nocardioidaceae bacterium]